MINAIAPPPEPPITATLVGSTPSTLRTARTAAIVSATRRPSTGRPVSRPRMPSTWQVLPPGGTVSGIGVRRRPKLIISGQSTVKPASTSLCASPPWKSPAPGGATRSSIPAPCPATATTATSRRTLARRGEQPARDVTGVGGQRDQAALALVIDDQPAVGSSGVKSQELAEASDGRGSPRRELRGGPWPRVAPASDVGGPPVGRSRGRGVGIASLHVDHGAENACSMSRKRLRTCRIGNPLSVAPERVLYSATHRRGS